MTPKQVFEEVLPQAYALLPNKPAISSPAASILLLATGLQESKFEHRRQMIKKDGRLQPLGPAAGFWQFEDGKMGGIVHVMTMASTKADAERICRARGVPFNSKAIWEAFQHDDVLAACFARLNYWTRPEATPAPGNPQKAWDMYVKTWHPGQPHRETWDGYYSQAMQVVLG